MRCPDCRAGQHQRTEVDVLVQDKVTLHRYVCACGICPQPCRAPEVGVETSLRWHRQHRFHEGTMLAAPFAACAAEPAGRHAARDAGREDRTALGRAAHRSDPDLPVTRAATPCIARTAPTCAGRTRAASTTGDGAWPQYRPDAGGQECRGAGRGTARHASSPAPNHDHAQHVEL